MVYDGLFVGGILGRWLQTSASMHPSITRRTGKEYGQRQEENLIVFRLI
jgi:hypothetical protein